MKKSLILIVALFAFASLSDIVWTKSVVDETEALDVVCGVREGGALVVSPVKSIDQFEMLREELMPNGVPFLGKGDGTCWVFDLKGCHGWEHAAFGRTGFAERTALLRVGKGLVVLASFDAAEDAAFREKLERELSLQNSGIVIKGTACGSDDGKTGSVPPRGEGYVDIRLASRFDEPVDVEGMVVVESSAGKKTYANRVHHKGKGDFSVRVAGDFLTYGETHILVSVTDVRLGKVYGLNEWTFDYPEYFTVVEPEYRGLVSVNRRDAAVHLGARFDKARNESFAGRAVKAVVTSPSGETVLDFKGVFGESDRVSFDVPLSRDAPEGTYAIACDSVGREGEKVHADGSFRIVPVRKGQVFVDQDGGLLADGKPWYPFGIYNICSGGEVGEAVDLGLEMAHTWSTAEKMIDQFRRKNMRLVVNNGAWKQVSEGWRNVPGVPAPVFGFETNAAFRAYAEMLLETPENIAFWCTSNGGGANELPGIRRISAYWRKLDPEDHPTYLSTSYEPRMKAGADVIGAASHPRTFGHKGPMTSIADLLDRLYADTSSQRCIIAVPECFGNTSARQRETPEECKCMAYLSMVHGAKGVFWYCWWDHEGQGAAKDPKIRKVITEVIAEAKDFKLALLAPGFTKLRSDDGKVHGCLCGDASTGRYLIFVNGTDDPSDSAIASPAMKGLSLEPLFGSPAINPDADGRVAISLGAMERAVWKVRE